MSNPIVVADPFSLAIEDVPTEQQRLQRMAEAATAQSVLQFEAEKQFVNRDHVAMQRHIWGESEDQRHPIELNDNGRKA